MLQSNGLSNECTVICLRKSHGLTKPFWHTSQNIFGLFSPVWIYMCTLRLCRFANDLLHCWHRNSGMGSFGSGEVDLSTVVESLWGGSSTIFVLSFSATFACENSEGKEVIVVWVSSCETELSILYRWVSSWKLSVMAESRDFSDINWYWLPACVMSEISQQPFSAILSKPSKCRSSWASYKQTKLNWSLNSNVVSNI